jgi:hypothetical protein
MPIKNKKEYFIPALRDIYFVFLLLAIYSYGVLLSDCDTGYHIRAGDYILENFSIPRTDIFSYISPALPWTAHEWLSEIIMSLAHKVLGLNGVVIFFSLVITITYYFLFRILRAHNGNLWLLLAMIALVSLTSTIHWLARPHIFTLLLLVVWYHLLDQYQYKDKNYLFTLPILMLLWVNLHGGFIIGFVLLGIYFIGNLIAWYESEAKSKSESLKKCRILAIIGIACLAASLVNPFGYQILLFPFKLVGDQVLMSFAQEHHPANLQNLHPYNFLLFLTLGLLMVSRYRVNFIELGLVLVFTYMSLYSIRNIPLFAIIVAPIVLKRLDAWFMNSENPLINFINRKSESFAETDAMARGFFWPGIATVLFVLISLPGIREHYFDPERKPLATVEFLKNEHIHGNMFNNEEFGDFIIYDAYPQYEVFIDGRNDMYGAEHVKDYIRVVSLGTGWEKVLEENNITWIFFDAESLLSRYLLEREDWHLIYADKVAHIYVRDIPEYEYLIEKYPDVEPVVYAGEY